ncbi:MogA/MoaB family molybdenum cofactor biosynthesis protein [Desulfobulbus oligotrophicus]|jgi:molybdenum cofactor synthesis domain-containing protein|uniref:Molybdopterin adenylyltransferase n=1 Tax=Desulfobulbus oligotrophicus TaxID=1909699 RepID=A0A7T5VEX6_9BACT|nr:MogA/MoaB family molybdenum cofactor biosynthesis protein [Desulfobulbus oligotrophicus]MDY0391698.1 MogA/MoaB family molybdenum cofactor biosynthesis protein [Desulfobulbus oligotrophicus]QQG66659.1 MogA/MoaB family molybdenum cofactor biosynthesis protein [Desulfobulbus oligotrophicus]
MSELLRSFRCGVLTLSDKGACGEREDISGLRVQEILQENGYMVVMYQILPDIKKLIEQTLIAWVDDKKLDLIVTTGGTGVSPRDQTPEATRAVIDREVPGLGEAMRQASLQKTTQAVWSRGIGGIRKNSLIINLPGSPKAVEENLRAVLPALEHGLEKLKGSDIDCAYP